MILGMATLTSLSRNSYITLPRRVTMAPTSMALRTLKVAMDFFAFVRTGLRPVIWLISAVAESRSFLFTMASPRPMLTMILESRGICMTLL